MLLCSGVEPPAQASSQAYRQWLKKVRLDEADAQYVQEDRLLALAQAEQRVKALDERIAEAAQREEHRAAVGRLCCFRGVDTLTAIIFLAELSVWRRCAAVTIGSLVSRLAAVAPVPAPLPAMRGCGVNITVTVAHDPSRERHFPAPAVGHADQ